MGDAVPGMGMMEQAYKQQYGKLEEEEDRRREEEKKKRKSIFG